ncbi:hypothetical protein HELRODRAFT_167865 [Helobdella robusta]|uniref:Uncharacterized protein n=1 Tax=Helobdella robusta TaxID=6412 RepID=T1EZW5_HELRO|nr:hypothetical protein HELRODRAFT_167865 [Helobdella robusta]ESO10028.1 hypothetical protein HELRODRAFT_167865 [Helobdella robusta]
MVDFGVRTIQETVIQKSDISSAYSTTYKYISGRKSILPSDNFDCEGSISPAFISNAFHYYRNDEEDIEDDDESFENSSEAGKTRTLKLLVYSETIARIFLPATCLMLFILKKIMTKTTMKASKPSVWSFYTM